MSAAPRRLLLAVATGQAVANLPPLMHVAGRGDEVCWLWSDAGALSSAEAASVRLRQRGLTVITHQQPLPDDLRLLGDWWRGAAARPPLAGRALVLVGNGGTKPLFAGLLQVSAGALEEVIYGEGQPVVLSRFAHGDMTLVRRETFGPSGLQLLDVLACTGHHLFRKAQPAPRLLWRDGVRQHETRPHHASVDAIAFQTAFLNRLRTEVTPAERRELTDGFESTVAQAVVDLLQLRPHWQQAVGEVWLGARLAHDALPTDQVVDWDVLLLLRNGVLLSIECKTGIAWRLDDTKKDLDARLMNTLHSGSALAEMWLCSPLPSGLAGHPAFRRLHAYRQYALATGRQHLAWTLPGQPRAYVLDGERFELPPFSDQLQALIAPYLPDLP